jgi:hypothetical protein
MTGSFAYDVFLSHNVQDKQRVRKLAERLRDAGLRVWFDEWVIKPGDDIYLANERGLETARVYVLCLSPAALTSKWVMRDTSTILSRDPSNASRRFVPLLLADCALPDSLNRYKYVDFRQETQEAFYELLAACRDETKDLVPAAQEELKRKPEYRSDDNTVKMRDAENGECRAITSHRKDGIGNAASELVDINESSKPAVYIQDRKYLTIQEAVDGGNPGETIILAAGTYQENLRIDKPFTIKGAGVEKTIIDGCGSGSVITVGWNRDDIDVTLTGITVTGGIGTNVRIDPSPTHYLCGGGIFNKGRLTITDCVISVNTAYCGGGIFNKGTLYLEKGASVNHNTAHDGGGVYGNIEKIIMNGGTVSSNEAEQLGGGIYIGYRGTISIHGGTISNNAAKNSGGGFYSRGLVTLREGTIFSNDASSSGGGIYCGGPDNYLNGGSIHGNTARIGAGALIAGGIKMTLDGTRIYSNTADKNGEDGLGGGIMNHGTLNLNNGSIDHNHASKNGGGILNSGNGKWIGNSALVHDNTLGSDCIPDDIAPLKKANGVDFVFCSESGEKNMLPKADQPIQLATQQAKEIEANRRASDLRSRFEESLIRLENYVLEQKIAAPECFISYAWGNPDQEYWVEKSLATDLQKAGIRVLLDRWHNPPGSSIGRFIDRLEKVHRIIVVGTVAYRKKYDNEESDSGTVVAAECAQINTRMRGSEELKKTIIPILLEGDSAQSFPPCLSDRVYSDFRNPESYFEKALELLLSLYLIPPQDPIANELRDSLLSREERGLFR